MVKAFWFVTKKSWWNVGPLNFVINFNGIQTAQRSWIVQSLFKHAEILCNFLILLSTYKIILSHLFFSSTFGFNAIFKYKTADKIRRCIKSSIPFFSLLPKQIAVVWLIHYILQFSLQAAIDCIEESHLLFWAGEQVLRFEIPAFLIAFKQNRLMCYNSL